MEPTTQNNTLRSLLIFIVIGAILLAAVILGVRWARGRSDQLANAGNQQQTEQPVATNTDQQEQKPAEQQPTQQQPQQAPAAQPQPAANNQVAANPTPASPAPTTSSTSTQAPSNQPVPAQVPSTGIEDAFLPIIAIAAMVFAGTTYMQSRRRLAPAKISL
jgi:outer membrane biosynthesis protein TonB